MKKLTQEQINKILEGHKHWLNEDCKGWETMAADFSSCDLSDAKEVPYIPMVCPEEGDFIGWKKAGNKIVKLRIPEDDIYIIMPMQK